jgi:tRNA pseudouridine32 synthase / 23S rRNA pseudouridine746 synthase
LSSSGSKHTAERPRVLLAWQGLRPKLRALSPARPSPFAPLAVQPPPEALPARLPNPFAPGPPHPLAREAAELLQRELATLPEAQREDLARGKMLGVLVARDADGQVGVLRAFAGMLEGRWDVDGFVGPVFDLAARNALWPDTERELRAFQAALEALPSAADAAPVRARLRTLVAEQARAEQALAARHEAARVAHAAERAALPASSTSAKARLQRLARQDRDARVESGRLRAAHAAARELLARALRSNDDERAAITRRRAARSNEVLDQLLDGYQLCNARGEVASVRALFAPDLPPGGAGDCAGPKLFAHAQRERLTPLALAEVWWGAPSPETGGNQRPGVYYPSCDRKCGPVLRHMLQGWDVDAFPG